MMTLRLKKALEAMRKNPNRDFTDAEMHDYDLYMHAKGDHAKYPGGVPHCPLCKKDGAK